MKKNKGNEFEHTQISWEEFEKEISAGRQDKERDKYEWDRPLVDETWSVDDPVTGELPKVPQKRESNALKGLTDLLPSEDAIYKATLDEDIDLSAAISRKLDSVAEAAPVDENAIRSAVDQKIVIKSEELKEKRASQDTTKKRKVRRRIPKNSAVKKDALEKQKLTAEEKRDRKYKHTELHEEPRMSAFREQSMNWKDPSGEVIPNMDDAEMSDFSSAVSRFFTRFKHYTALEWVSAVLAVIIVASAAMTTAVYANYKGEQNRALALASLKQFEETQTQRVAETVVENEKEATTGAQDEIVEIKSLSLVLSSVEKDLKIKLVDQNDSLVKDVPWGVTVTDKDGKVSDNDDDDEDGIIYLTDIGAGDYSVELKPSDALADYILPKSAQTVSVKAKVEYKVIANIKDEIKTEKEVNAAAEDNGNKPADVETSTVTDTVEWVESTKTANGDAYVESAIYLDYTGIGTAAKSFTGNLVSALDSLSSRISRGYNTILGMPVYVASSEPTGDPEPSGDPSPSPEPSGDPSPSPEPSGDPSPSPEPTADPSPSPSPTTDPTPTTTTTPTPSPTPSPTPTPGATVAVTKLTMKPTEVSIAVAANYQLAITVEPTNATDKKVTWSSSDTSVATVSDGGNVKGVKEGKATITATAHDGSGKTATCTVTVSAKKYDASAQLYDKDKNPLYRKKDDGSYVLAKYADYEANKSIKLYKKTQGYLYTGWQTIEGKTYYYKKDNTYVTGDQIIGGVTYHFATDGSLTQGSGTLGIDVSKYQPSINWSSVKNSGVSFVIIRCGYRGASTGALIEDPYFKSHIKGAKSAGLKVGVYFFTTALTEAEAIEEASMCAYLCSGYGINYPVFMDCESSNRPGYNGLSASQRTQIIQAFCNTLKSAGYTPGVYANKTWLTEKMSASALSGYKIWLAQYNAAGPTYNGRYDLWQYTSKGSVSGISGNVDMNQSYLGY